MKNKHEREIMAPIVNNRFARASDCSPSASRSETMVTDGPYYTNCANKRDKVHAFCFTVIFGGALAGFVLSLDYLNGMFLPSNDCIVGIEADCIPYNGQNYQYTYSPGWCYVMIGLVFGPIALWMIASFFFWFMKPPRHV